VLTLHSSPRPLRTADPWPHISEAAKDAVRMMMTWSPDTRPSAREMLGHEWIKEGGVAGDNAIQPEVIHRMKVRGRRPIC
jgi:calcium-dependent protein kinase